jgi:hypothetical protein
MNKRFVIPVVSILTPIAVYAIITLWVAALDSYYLTKAHYDSANICTGYWVAQGVERRNIIRTDGICTIVTGE